MREKRFNIFFLVLSIFSILFSEPRACGRPEQPANSTMSVTNPSAKSVVNSYEVGAAVEYTCNPGSLLIGPTTRTCLDTGFYNEFPPVCKSEINNLKVFLKLDVYLRANHHFIFCRY